MFIKWRKFYDLDMKDVGGKLDTISTGIGEIKTEQAEAQKAVKKVTDDIEELKGLKTEIEKLKTETEKFKTSSQEHLNKMQEKLQAKGGLPNGLPENFHTELGKKLAERKDDLKKFKENGHKGFGAINMETKAVGDMGAGNLVGSYFVTPQVIPGVFVKPYETIHMRNLLPVGQTTSDTIRYVRDMGGEGGPGMVAMGATKPQIDRDLEIFDAHVRKIATYFRVPEEMLDDISYLQSFLSQIGIEEVMLLEDSQILYGDGTGQNLSGLFTNATAFSAGTSKVTAPNIFDVLLAAKKQARLAKANPTIALLSPEDFFVLLSAKDTTNNYLFLGGGNGIDGNGVLNARGLRVIEHTSIVPNDFLVLDPSKVAIFDRMGTTVRFYDQDQDNAIKNLITIVIEKRLALPIYRTEALIKGTISAAIESLTPA